MITWTSLTPRALKAVVEGRITREDVREAFHRMEALMAGEGKVDLLADEPLLFHTGLRIGDAHVIFPSTRKSTARR